MAQFNNLKFERVGLLLRPEMLAIKDATGDAGKFADVVKFVAGKTDAALMLMSDNADVTTISLRPRKT